MRRIKRNSRGFVAGVLSAVLLALPVSAAQEDTSAQKLEEGAKSVLLMDAGSGEILYSYNAEEQMPPASITKVMTLLLTMEAVENGKISLDDQVVASEHAASMGGSQIWLKAGEEMSLADLIKATTIKSANDAACALAEHVAGSEEAFVEKMNERAQQLGMTGTVFKNSTGLDADGHLSTAQDIAIMSRELLRHPKILEYSTIWMDSLRNGETELVNTNRLIRFYEGATGLKTGTTDGAGSCISATAERNGLSLIAVVMGAANSDSRNEIAKRLLDWGFANYETITPEKVPLEINAVKVLGGVEPAVEVDYEVTGAILLEKGKQGEITRSVFLADDLQAPVEQGQRVGTVRIELGGQTLCEYPIVTLQAVDEMTLGRAFGILMEKSMSLMETNS